MTGMNCRRNFLVVFCLLLFSIPSFAAEEQKAANTQPQASGQIDNPEAGNAQNSLDMAIEQAREEIEKKPSSAEDRVALGYLLLKKGLNEEAGKAFDEALSLNGRYHDALTGKGIILERMGEDQEAEKLLRQALVLNPNPVRTYYELGRLYEKRGDFAQAITEYKNGLEKYKQGRR